MDIPGGDPPESRQLDETEGRECVGLVDPQLVALEAAERRALSACPRSEGDPPDRDAALGQPILYIRVDGRRDESVAAQARHQLRLAAWRRACADPVDRRALDGCAPTKHFEVELALTLGLSV